MFKIIVLIFSCLLQLTNVFCNQKNSEIAEVLHRPIRALSYPDPSSMGIFFALAVPLSDPYKSISLSYFFEASYPLPPNSTILEPWFEGRSRKKRGIDRARIYETLENKFESHGFPGRECLVRAICEASMYDLEENGVLGDLVKVLFTPSTSKPEDLPQDIVQAEMTGSNSNCSKYQSACPVGLFDLIGILV